MRFISCSLLVALIMTTFTSGCGGSSAPKLDPEVAKERQKAYESKMKDGPPRGGKKK